jgi:hypothetical protein
MSRLADSLTDSTLITIPAQPQNCFRVTLNLPSQRGRLDGVLMEELRKQNRCLALKIVSRTEFKELFKKKRIRIKGQAATPSSSIAQGTTFVDIIGYQES